MKKIFLFLIAILLLTGCSKKEIESNVSCVESKNKDACYHDLAVSKKDASYCDYIINNTMLYNCYGAVASHTGNDKLLDKILDKKAKNHWTQEVAYTNIDPLLCEKITDTIKKNGCLSFVSSLKGGDQNICERIEESKYNVKGQCYFDLAIKKLNTTYCETGNYKKVLCFSSVAVEKKDMNICGRLNDLQEKDNCYVAYARETINEEVCKKVTKSEFEQLCYLGVANAKKDQK